VISRAYSTNSKFDNVQRACAAFVGSVMDLER
jgi:hypothetical protein